MGDRDREYVEFVEAASASLRRTAYLVCGDWHRADDVVQDALYKLYLSWLKVDRSGNPFAYARRVVVNAALDTGRRPWHRTAFVAASPDGRTVATCDVYGRSIPAGQGQSSFTQVHPPRSAPATVDPNLMGQGSTCATAVPLPCKGWLLLDAGLAPKQAVKLRIDAKNGHTLVVPIRDGWWLALWPTGANGQMPADYRFYDANGQALPQGPAAMEKIRIP